jgi:hypothetical protein
MRKADKFNPFRAEERLRRVKRATFAGIIFGNRSLILITRQWPPRAIFCCPGTLVIILGLVAA